MDVSPARGRRTRLALIASFSLNIVLLAVLSWPDAAQSDAPTPEAERAKAAPVEVAAETTEVAATPDEAPEVEETADAEPPSDVQVTVASVQGSIPQTMAVAAKPYGEFVSATLSRLLVWELDLRRDLRAGDKVEAMWSLGTSDTVVIEAARYHAQKHGRTVTAYRFQATGDAYPSYWSADGVEVPHRLRNSPLADYEQITSLLKDRPNHKGMDFKVPVGTEVLATSDGVVTRANWNWNANGNCVEIRHDDGVLAKYLHLSENRVEPGDRVRPGDVIALSGNTGRSTGPHLHYQLNRGSQVVDPIEYHGTDRRTLPDGDQAAFDEVVSESNERLSAGQELAAR